MAVFRASCVNCSSRNHGFRHSTASILEAVRRWRFSLMVFVVAEKSRSTSEDMAGTDRKLMAIRDRVENRVLCAISVYYLSAVDVSILMIPLSIYLLYLFLTILSLSSASISACYA